MALKLPAPIQGDWSDGKHKNIGIYTSEGGVYDANQDCFQDEINSVLSDLYEKGEDGKFHLKSGITQAKNGVVKGDSAVFLFKNIIPNSDGSNIVAPTFETMDEVTRSEDWKRNDNDLPDLQNGEYTYMTYATLSGVTNRFSTWSKPMRITGANGEKGADGTDIEFIYTLYTPTEENPIPPYVPGKAILGINESYIGNGGTSEEAEANYNTTGKRYKITNKDYVGYRNSNQWNFDGNTGNLPCVWTDNPTGVSDDNQYEWVCMRYSINDSNGRAIWSAYQDPSLWSKWGENGQDGDGVEYIFTRTNSKPSSSEDISSIIPYVPQTTEEHYQDSEYTGLSIEEYTSLYGSFPNEDIWSDDPQGATKKLPYEWVVMRKKKNNVWKEFGKPSLWSIYAFDGGKTVFIYKKSQAILNSRPVSSDSKVIPSGWSVTETELTESEKRNGYNIFMSYSDYSEKTESYGTWSIPVRITGQDGEKGADGTDIEFIYARTENNIAPTYVPLKNEPSYIDETNVTRSFSKDDYTGYPTKELWESKAKAEDRAGKTWIKWYDNPQGVTETLKYEWVAVRYSSLDSNKNKAWNDEFQSPSLWSKWGDKGQDGDGYEYIFKATAANLAAPEAPDASYQWTPEEGSEYEDKNTTDITKDDFIPNGWTDDPQGVNSTNRQIEYVSVRKKKDNTWGPYSEPKVWARYAKDGDTGNTYKYAYTVTVDNAKPEPDRPINKQAPSHPWYSDESMLGKGIVWMSSCLFNPNTNTYGNWSDPIRLTGDKGEKGADGTDIEFIYIGGPIESFINEHPISLTPWTPTTAQSSGVYKGKNTRYPSDDDFIPENWLDNPPSLDGVNIKYIWVATRSKENDTWSNFGSPSLWSRWGENGRDGDGVEYIYKLSTKLLSDSEILSSGYDSSVPSENSAADKPSKDDFVPDGWSDDPSGVTSNYPYEYVSIRKKKTLKDSTTATWKPFVKPTLWATWTANGTTITFIYKNSSTDPGDIDAATWSGASTIPTGWSKNMTNPGTNQYTYMSQSYTKKNGDTIVYEGWSKPARISGADGKPGTDGADIEYVYLRTKSVPQVNGVISSPATPTGDADTNDDYSPVGNIDSEPEDNWGWFDHPQGVNGKWKYEWVSIRTKKAASENEATHWSEYSPPVIWASFGEKGQDGDGVEYIYKTTPTITPPTKPGTTSEWLWTPNEGSSEEGKNTTNPNEEDFIPKGWADDPLDVSLENQFQWVCSRKKVTDPNTSLTHFGDFTEPKLWSRWGAAGDSLISIYCYTVVDKSDFTDPASPSSPLLDHEPSTSGESSNGAVWYPAMPSPTVPDNKTAIIWSSQNKKYWSDEVGDFVIDSSDWSAPARISGKNGLPGEDGDSIEFIYFRTDAIDNITWGNSGSEYVHPKNIRTGSKDYLDSTTNLPSDGFIPSGWTDHPQGVENAVNKRYEWVSSRTKKKQENSDTRIWGSFSDPAIWARYSQDGKDGDGVEYVFYIDSDGDEDSSPATPSLNSWNPGNDPEYVGKNTTKPADDDFIPEGWTDDPKLNNSKDGTIEWVSIRKSITNGNGKRTWQGFSKPTVWARASKDGEAGNSTVFIYKLSEDDIDVAPTSSGSVIPTGWSLKMPAYEAGKGIYMSFAEKNNTTGIYGTWSIPTKITGDDGQPGKDGEFIEFIYARVKEEPNKPKEGNYPNKESIANQKLYWNEHGFIPEKSDLDADKDFDAWTDHPQGVDKDNTHEWVCTRKWSADQKTFSGWTAPALWSKFGEKGQDGDGVQYIYKRNGDETSAPELVENGDNLPNGWNEDPLGVTELLPFEWVSTRKKKNNTWGHWSDPVIWSRYAVTYQIETIFLNQSIDLAAPEIPSTEVGKTTIPSGWSKNAVSPETGNVTYMSQSNKNTTTGKYVGWSTPIRITGTDGHNGTDGTAIEFIYKLYKPTSAKPTPAAPGTTPAAGSPAYNSGRNAGFIPEGWTNHPTGIDPNNTHEWMCTRTYDPDADDGKGAWRAFIGPSLWSRWGENGTDGDGVYYWFLRYSGTAPTVDTVTLGKNGVPENFGGVAWTDNPKGVDKNNKKEYVLMVRYANKRYTISSVTLWKEFVKDGSSIISIYLNNDGGNPNLIEYSPNNRIPAGWSKNLSYETGKVTWMAQATLDPSTNLYSTWQGPFRVTGDKGEPGNDGTNIEFIYLKTNESVSQSTVAEYVDTLNSDSLKSYFNVDDFPTSSAKNYSEFHDLLSSQISSIGEWHDSPQGVDSKQSLEWISQRIKDEGEDDWGIFSPPVLWSKYGHDGKDGDGIEYRFKLVSSAEADNVVNAPSTVNEYNSKWTADPSKEGVSEEYPIEYCCIRKTKVNDNGVAVDSFSVSVWNEFSPYTRYAEVGYIKSKSGDLSGLAFGTTKGGPNSNYYLTTSSSSSIGAITNDSITDGALLYVILTVKNLSENCVVNLDICNKKNNTKIYDAIKTRFIGEDIADGSVITKDGSYKILVEYVGFKNSDFSSDIYIEPIVLSKTASTTNKAASIEVSSYRLSNISQSSTADSKFIGVLTGSLVRINSEVTTYSGVDWTAFEWSKISGIDGTSSVQIVSDSEIIGVTAESIISDNEANSEVTGYTVPITTENPAIFNCKLMEGNNNVTSSANWRFVANSQFEDNVNSIGGYKSDNYTIRVTGCALGTTTNTNLKPEITVTASYKGEDYTKVLYIGITKVDYTSIFNVTNKQFKSQFDEFTKSFDGKIKDATTSIEQTANELNLLAKKSSTGVGTNLIKNSVFNTEEDSKTKTKIITNWSGNADSVKSITGDSARYKLDSTDYLSQNLNQTEVSLKSGSWYTISFDVESDADNSYITVGGFKYATAPNSDSNYSFDNKISKEKLSGGAGGESVTWKTDKDLKLRLTYTFYNNNSNTFRFKKSGSGNVYISKIKLEEGKVSTPWMSDVLTMADVKSQIKVEAGQIESKVSKSVAESIGSGSNILSNTKFESNHDKWGINKGLNNGNYIVFGTETDGIPFARFEQYGSANSAYLFQNGIDNKISGEFEKNSWYTLSWKQKRTDGNNGYVIASVSGVVADYYTSNDQTKISGPAYGTVSERFGDNKSSNDVYEKKFITFFTKSSFNAIDDSYNNRRLVQFTYGNDAATNISPVTIAGIKLEKGKYATDWSDDGVSNYTLESRITQTEQSISLKVIDGTPSANKNLLKNTTWDGVCESDKFITNPNWNLINNRYENFDYISLNRSTDVNDSYNGKPTLVIQSDLNQNEPSGQAFYELQQGVALNKNSIYTLSFFYRTSKNTFSTGIYLDGVSNVNAYVITDFVNVTKSSVFHSGDNAALWNIWPDTNGNWHKAVVTFQTGTNVSSGIFFIRQTSNNDAADSSDRLPKINLACLKLEAGNEPTSWYAGVSADDLLATGIDIDNKSVVVTADNFKVRTKDGTTNFIEANADGTLSLNSSMIKLSGDITANGNVTIDSNGCITAKNANIQGTVDTTDESGHGIKIDPDSQKITVYDDTGNEVTSISGEKKSSAAEIYGNSASTPEIIFDPPTIIGGNNWKVNISEDLRATYDLELLSYNIELDSATEVTIQYPSINLSNTLTSNDFRSTFDNPDGEYWNFYCYFHIYLSGVGYIYQKTVYKPEFISNGYNYPLCQKEKKSFKLSEGAHELFITVTLEFRSNYKRYVPAENYLNYRVDSFKVQPAGDSNKVIITAIPNTFTSRLFSNGLSLGTNYQDNLTIINGSGGTGTSLLYINGNTGFKLTNEGVYVSYNAGSRANKFTPIYSRVPEILCVGYVEYFGTDYYQIKHMFGSRLNTNTTFTNEITRLKEGKVSINFSKFLNVSEEEWNRVFITITPGLTWGGNPSHVSISHMTFTDSTFVIGDDSSPNDGHFYFKLELL